jgi:SH3 domain protein
MPISRKKLLFLAIILYLLFYNTLVSAKIKYVTDDLVIHMRAGQGNNFKIIKIVKSGTPLTIIQKNSGYTQAKTPGGTTGWVLSRFLVNTPVARTLLNQAQQDVTQMRTKYDIMEAELSAIKIERETLSNSESALLTNKETLNIELSKLKKIAARPMQLEKENDQLRNDLVKIESENRLLKQEYQSLEDDSDQQWFMTGASVLFGGILLGLIFPKLRYGQKKANWNRL